MTSTGYFPGLHSCADRDLIADRKVIRDTHLAGHDNVIASARRARDADLTAQDVMFPDLAVMADHHQVVDFRSRSDAGDAECSPIDRAASPNFDVVLDLDRSQLRYLQVPAILHSIAKPIRADDGIRMHNDAVAEPTMIVEHDMRMKNHVMAQLTVSANRRGAWSVQWSPISLLSPMIEYGPTLTPTPNFAVGWTRAVGSTVGDSGVKRPRSC